MAINLYFGVFLEGVSRSQNSNACHLDFIITLKVTHSKFFAKIHYTHKAVK